MRALVIASIVLASTPALAFHEIASFDRSANTGGGAGYYYTGSPRFKGYDCNVCHLGAAKQISIELGGNLVGGTYRSGLLYTVELRLVGEHRGLGSAFNPNTFTAEFVDRDGNAIGTIAPAAGSTVERVDDGRVAVARGLGNGETEWTFEWASPATPVPATLHVAMLDGDGANDPVRRFIDPLNDDVVTIAFDLCPEGMQCDAVPEPPEETSPAGCRAAVRGGGSWLAVALCLLLFVARTRSRRSEKLAAPRSQIRT